MPQNEQKQKLNFEEMFKFFSLNQSFNTPEWPETIYQLRQHSSGFGYRQTLSWQTDIL